MMRTTLSAGLALLLAGALLAACQNENGGASPSSGRSTTESAPNSSSSGPSNSAPSNSTSP